MRYCPVCHERYDEEIIKFCTKDGTTLIEEDRPNFTAMPSDSFEPPDDDIGQETVIRRRSAENESGQFDRSSERIVIPTSEQQVRPRQNVSYYPPPPPQNNVKTIVLTIIGTLVVLGFGALLFKVFQGEPANINVNTNPPNMNANLNANLNSNMGFDSNFNFNTNANFNSNFNALANFNLNTNMRSPTSTPTSKPSPSPTPTSDDPTPSPTPRTPANTNRATPSQTPRMTPRPPGANANRPPENR